MGGGLQKDNGKCQQIISFLSNLIDGLALENGKYPDIRYLLIGLA